MDGSIDRRAAIGLVAAGALATAAKGADGAPRDEVIDWNDHMWSSNLARFPFHPNASYIPKNQDFAADPLPPYLQRMERDRVDKAVLVQPEPYGDDHSLVLACLQTGPAGRLKGASLFYPKDPDAPRKLVALVKREPRIIATRFHAHRGKEMYMKSFADPGVRALWKQAVDLDLIIELHIGPNYASQCAAAIAAFPGCKVLIDHLAEQQWGTAAEFSDVLDLTRFPNVYMKISGINHFAGDGPLYLSALPFTRRVIKEFGPNRIVWSSGTPGIADAHMPGFSQPDIARVKGGNLKRLLNW